MDIKNFGKKEGEEELFFELYDVKFYLKDLSFGQILKFQKKLKGAYEVDTNLGEEYRDLNVTTESAHEMLQFIVNSVTHVEGLENDGEPVEELTVELLEDMPAELINEIFVGMNEVYSGNVDDASKKK